MDAYHQLPPDLPTPSDDGAASHLRGLPLPSVTLTSTDGRDIDLSQLSDRVVLFAYPMTGVPGVALPVGWDDVPGARGCTPEACSFRDHFDDLQSAGVTSIFGLSAQDTDYQREVRERLHLPFPMLSDGRFLVAEALGLPTFTIDDMRYYARLTMVVGAGIIEHVFYPVFPTDQHASEVLSWVNGQIA